MTSSLRAAEHLLLNHYGIPMDAVWRKSPLFDSELSGLLQAFIEDLQAAELHERPVRSSNTISYNGCELIGLISNEA